MHSRSIAVAVAATLISWWGSASGSLAYDNTNAQVVVTQIARTAVTAAGQPLALPQKNAEVAASLFEIPVGASLPVHQHPFPRYAYVLAGTLQVTDVETGKSNTYKVGDFIVEMTGRWHQGANIGADTVKLLVIDQVEQGKPATIPRQ